MKSSSVIGPVYASGCCSPAPPVVGPLFCPSPPLLVLALGGSTSSLNVPAKGSSAMMVFPQDYVIEIGPFFGRREANNFAPSLSPVARTLSSHVLTDAVHVVVDQ